MAVKSMRFQSNTKVPDETKTGYVIWDGNAHDYPHWKYRTNMKFLAIKHVKQAEYATKFCETMIAVGEALRGDALTVQMDIGEAILDHTVEDGEGNRLAKGHKLLMEKMQQKVYPQVDEEAKAMYTEFHTVGSSLARQPTESMLAYIQKIASLQFAERIG